MGLMKAILLWSGCIYFYVASAQQQPGGLTIGPKLWLVPLLENGSYKWISKNKNPKVKFLTPIAARDTQNINFHTALKFLGTERSVLLSNLKPGAVVSIFYPDVQDRAQPSPDSFFTVKFNGSLLVKAYYDELLGSGNNKIEYPVPITGALKSTAMKVFACYFPSYPAMDKGDASGNILESKLTMTLDGICPEMLIYDRPLSPEEVLKVQTYLAIKYGITLDTSYKGPDGDILWDRALRAPFHNRVCAIGKDYKGAIQQPFSNTTYEEGEGYVAYNHPSNGNMRSITIGFEHSVFNTLPDKCFLFWGDNNVAMRNMEKKQITGSRGDNKVELTQRKWLVQNEMNVKVPTKVALGGNLLSELKEDDYCYVLVKLNGSLDSSDIFPLKKERGAKWSRNDIRWESGVDSFAMGKIPALRFLAVDDNDHPINMADLDLSSTRQEQGWTFVRKGFACILNCKWFLYSYTRTPEIGTCPSGTPNKCLQFYFTGGDGPYFYKLQSDTSFKPLIWKKDGGFNIGKIENLPAGRYTITITDMSRQEDELKVRVSN